MNGIDVSVLLCTLNRAHYLDELLGRLVAQELPGNLKAEIVVVDNGSTDETRATVERSAERGGVPIRFVFEPTRGVHQARNRSIKEGRGEWLAFLDDDELPDSRWLAGLLDAADETGAQVLGGSVLLKLSEETLQGLGPETRASLRERAASRFGDRVAPFRRGAMPGTDNLLMSRVVLDEVGGFDESMTMGGADLDLMIRARNAGFESWYVPSAVVWHRIPADRLTAEFLRRDSYQSGVVLALLKRRYHGWLRVFVEMFARIGQTLLVTLPILICAAVLQDHARVLDRKLKLWRTIAFVKYAMMMAFPGIIVRQSFLEDVAFRRGGGE